MASSASTQVREGWQELPLIECTSDHQISYGVVQPGFPVTDGVPIVRVNNLVNGRIITHDAMRIAPEIDYSHRRTKLRGGEIVISLVGTTGSVAIVPGELAGWNVARAIAVIRPDEKIGASWLKLCLESSHTREYLDARANTTVQKTLNLKDVKQLPIPLPPPHWRQEILSLVSPIENAITNLEDQNRSLEATAQTIFKSWFVDFDPVRAKAEGREPDGMDADTAALFPCEFEETPLGSVPCGWGVVNLGELAEFAYGKPLKAENRNGGTVPVMGSNGRVGWHDEALVRGPGIVVGRKGNPGTVTWVDSDFFPIDTTFFVRPRNLARGLHILKNQLDLLNLPDLSADSAVPGLNREMAYQTKLANPPKFIANLFEDIVGPLAAKAAQNEGLVATLAELRDTLLPRLISGKLRVPEIRRKLC